MVEQLFGSKTRVKLLKLFYENPNRSFYVREITRKIDEQINSVRRELSNLLSIGIITSENTNNKLYYEVNQKFEYYVPLAQIFGNLAVSKQAPKAQTTTTTDSDKVPNELQALGHIELALYTGKFTRDEKSGIDFMVVGDINQNQMDKFISDLEKKEGRDIRYVTMDKKEFLYRQQINDKFLAKVTESKKQVLYDKNLLDLNVETEDEEQEKTKKSKSKK